MQIITPKISHFSHFLLAKNARNFLWFKLSLSSVTRKNAKFSRNKKISRKKMHKFHWKKLEHFKKIILQQNFLHRTFIKVMKEKLFNMILLNFSYSDLRAEHSTRCFLQLIVAATTLMVFADILFREIIFS